LAGEENKTLTEFDGIWRGGRWLQTQLFNTSAFETQSPRGARAQVPEGRNVYRMSAQRIPAPAGRNAPWSVGSDGFSEQPAGNLAPLGLRSALGRGLYKHCTAIHANTLVPREFGSAEFIPLQRPHARGVTKSAPTFSSSTLQRNKFRALVVAAALRCVLPGLMLEVPAFRLEFSNLRCKQANAYSVQSASSRRRLPTAYSKFRVRHSTSRFINFVTRWFTR